MGKGIFVGGLLSITLAFLGAGTVHAQEYNHTITVYATVAEQRAIYLDDSGNIIKVAGNTSRNITPLVYNSNNKLIDMNDSITSQYQAFLNQYHNHLAAGKIYTLNPIEVNTQPNSVSINVSTSPQASLTLSLQK